MVESHLLPTFKNQIRQKNLDFWLLLKKGFTIRHQAVEICGSERAAPLLTGETEGWLLLTTLPQTPRWLPSFFGFCTFFPRPPLLGQIDGQALNINTPGAPM